MSTIKTGGFAFPILNRDFSEGMTLRDYFAAKVVAVLIADENYTPSQAAYDAYKTADAMIKEREKE